jgi:hypothetical protein
MLRSLQRPERLALLHCLVLRCVNDRLWPIATDGTLIARRRFQSIADMGRQQLGLVVEMIFESCSCGLGLMIRRRTVRAWSPPVRNQRWVRSPGSDRGHDVPILMAVTGVVGR